MGSGDRAPPRAWLLYASGSAVLLVVYYALPSVAQDVLYNLTGYGALGVIAVRVFHPRWRVSDRGPWLLLGAGLLAFVAADHVWDYYTYALGVESPFPSAADGFYLAAYPLLVAGVLSLVGRQAPGRDLSNLLDGAIVATGLGLVVWVYLVEPLAGDPDLSGLGKAIAVSYPLMDVLVVWVLAQLALAGGLATPARRLLAASFACLLAADVAYSVAQLAGTYADGSLIDAGWLASYVALAAAALHPSAEQATPAAPLPPAPLTTARLALLCAAALSGLTVLGIEAVGGRTVDGAVIAISSAALFALVTARLAGVTRALAGTRDSLAAALAREQILHDAAARLAGTADRGGIESVAARARWRLLAEPAAASAKPEATGDGQAAQGADPAAKVSAEARSALETLASHVALACQRADLADQLSRQAVASERLHLAREVHDVVSHGLSAIVMAAAGSRRAAPASPGRALAALGDVEVRGREAMEEMRRLVALLRSDFDGRPSASPGLAALDDLVQRTRGVGMDVDLTVAGDLGALTPGVDLCAYRIVQESLTNAVKHAGRGAHVAVAIRRRDELLEITVKDDGPTGTAAALAARWRPRGSGGGAGPRRNARARDPTGRRSAIRAGAGRRLCPPRAPPARWRRVRAKMIGVVVVDDDPLVCQAVSDMLAPEADIAVLARAADGQQAMEAVERVRPEVVVMDIQMPGRDGIETTRRLRDVAPETAVLVLAVHLADDAVWRALQAGARGFVLKGDPPDLLIDAVRLVAAGGALLAPPTGRVLDACVRRGVAADTEARLATLTLREREVLSHVALGDSNGEIAGALLIGEETVKTHVTQVLAKLDCNRVQAATLAWRADVVAPPTDGRPPL